MSVTTRLTWKQKRILQNYFGGKNISLLFKASVQGFSLSTLDNICSRQGPMIVVIYSGDLIIGVHVQNTSSTDLPASTVLFFFYKTWIAHCSIKTKGIFANFLNKNLLHTFVINLNGKKVFIESKIIEQLDLPKSAISANTILFQECEVFRCEDERTLNMISEYRKKLLDDMRTYKPYGHLVHQIRILLLGPIGAGKSSFVNSVKSVFQGHVNHPVFVGFDKNGMSETFRTYTINDGKVGKPMPFILCDSMGLDEENGICMDDITNILKGHVSDRYQLNPGKPITPDNPNYINDPSLKDRIHCVAFVLNVNSVDQLSEKMIDKIKIIRRELIKHGVVHVVLLTNVDKLDLITKSDFLDIYRCAPVKSKLEVAHDKLGIALSDILVVSNYSNTSEWELDPLKDILILSVLRQLLWAANDFLEDLPHYLTSGRNRE